MTDKTAIDALKKICSIETGTWDKPVPFSKLYHEAKGIATEALAAIEAEKPAEDAESFLNSIFDAIKENGIITNHNYGMRLTKESHDACIKIITAYHAEQCTACRKDRQQLPEDPRV